MCLFPINASQDTITDKITQQIIKFGTPKPNHEGDIQIPCGKCIECIQAKSIEWAIRVKHELSLHLENCFITLTYDEDHLKSPLVVYEDFQNFIRRLKREFKQKKIRYIMSAEYGDNYKRPHFHAIIFGINFDNLKYHSTTKSGSKIYTSKQLEKLWTNGYSSIGEANERTAYYIASYCLSDTRHIFTDETGEVHETKNFLRVSKNPAIGLEYLKQNIQQITDSFKYNGQKIPRYYEKKLADEKFQTINNINSSLIEEIQNEKYKYIKQRSDYEKHAKHTISHSKNTLHSNNYRGDYDQKKINFQEVTLRQLKQDYEQLGEKK